MEVYFDNAATTRCSRRAAELMQRILLEDYGNPSSLHRKGMEAEAYIKTAAGQLAHILKVDKKELIFTSGGTESNNLALIGTALANRRAGTHIITTAIEHASVYNPLIFLEERGVYVSSGSACSSNHPAISGTLQAIGVKRELLDATIRFSMSMESTREEADYVLGQLGELLPVLRRFRRR